MKTDRRDWSFAARGLALLLLLGWTTTTLAAGVPREVRSVRPAQPTARAVVLVRPVAPPVVPPPAATRAEIEALAARFVLMGDMARQQGTQFIGNAEAQRIANARATAFYQAAEILLGLGAR